jgi:superfamily I DNA and/or RNA helicase|tara:strand:- start:216 stop:551 length:336 start_codon:yes stop_codon:yes gene_type:complete
MKVYLQQSVTSNKKNIMQQRETVEEYLKRGGKIERNPQVLNTITSIWSIAGEPSNKRGAALDPENSDLKAVSWKSVQSDERFDEYNDAESKDEAYWKKLNKKLDKVIKKLK